jgi:hypothetical protein
MSTGDIPYAVKLSRTVQNTGPMGKYVEKWEMMMINHAI